jgi:hypothetical protein
MAQCGNFAPGDVVPKSGRYRCILCGKGGMVDVFQRVVFAGLRESSKKMRKKLSNFLKQERNFPNVLVVDLLQGGLLLTINHFLERLDLKMSKI